MITNQSTVSGWTWTNESVHSPTCQARLRLVEDAGGFPPLEDSGLLLVGVEDGNTEKGGHVTTNDCLDNGKVRNSR